MSDLTGTEPSRTHAHAHEAELIEVVGAYITSDAAPSQRLELLSLIGWNRARIRQEAIAVMSDDRVTAKVPVLIARSRKAQQLALAERTPTGGRRIDYAKRRYDALMAKYGLTPEEAFDDVMANIDGPENHTLFDKGPVGLDEENELRRHCGRPEVYYPGPAETAVYLEHLRQRLAGIRTVDEGGRA